MRNTVLVASLLSVLGSGCYFGRSPSHKQAAYVANGAVAAVGVALMAGARSGSCDDEASCNERSFRAGGADLLGMTLLGAAAIGALVTLAVPTRTPESDDPIVYANAPAQQTVTAPGLKPASVTLR